MTQAQHIFAMYEGITSSDVRTDFAAMRQEQQGLTAAVRELEQAKARLATAQRNVRRARTLRHSRTFKLRTQGR